MAEETVKVRINHVYSMTGTIELEIPKGTKEEMIAYILDNKSEWPIYPMYEDYLEDSYEVTDIIWEDGEWTELK